jgi:hypothetical protein
MIWIDNISQLQYYNQPKDVPCYCEVIIFPSDLMLQGSMSAGGGSYSIQVDVMSANGLTVYENATSYFEYYFAVNPINGNHFFNARLKSFAPSMCSHACYILRVKVTRDGNVVFDKYTERYCQSTCCDLARDITVSQSAIVPTVGSGSTDTPVTSYPKQTECGDPLITITSRFDCYDKFTGEYYGNPPVVISGSASFTYYKFSNIRGRIVKRPREITREYSMNCRLQLVESKPVYLLEGYEYFPPWKMEEIEGQLHATEIYVEGKRYEYSGGSPFKQLHNCREVFKLETTLEQCLTRQLFGCPDPCDSGTNYDGMAAMFVIPEGYQGGGFFNESKVLIADDYEQLLTYIRSMDGMTGLNDIDLSGLDCNVYKAFSISGNGYLPGSFYYDSPTGGNRVYGTVLNSVDDICRNYAPACAKPVLVVDDVVIEDQPCVAPELGEAIIEEMLILTANVDGYGDWEVIEADTEVTVADGIVTLALKVITDTITEDPDNPGVNLFIGNPVIAVLGAAARPAQDVFLNDTNSALPDGALLHISTHGLVRYVGYTTAVSDDDVTIQLTNIHYDL